MKRIITAIGNEKLNNILKESEEIVIENPDIQYQEGIVEALDKYPLTDIVILKDDIIGEMSLEDLIFSITIMKNDIEIIVITEHGETLSNNKNVVKIVNDKINYVDIVIMYLTNKVYISNINATKKQMQEEESVVTDKGKVKNNISIQGTSKESKIAKKLKSIFRKKEKEVRLITVIGHSGSR